MKTSWALPCVGWFSNVGRNATFVPLMSERERRNHFGMAKRSHNRLPFEVIADFIFPHWFHDKISNVTGLLLGGNALVWPRIPRATRAQTCYTR